MADKKKAALDSFFNKSKKKTAARGYGESTTSAEASYSASSSNWVEDTEALQPSHVVDTTALSTRVGDLREEDLEKFGISGSDEVVDIVAEEAKKLLMGTLKKAAKKKTDPSGPPAASAVPRTWGERMAMKKSDKVDVRNTMQFPDLKDAMSGLPLGAKLEAPKDITRMAGTKNAWAALAEDESDHDDEDEDNTTAAVNTKADAKESDSKSSKMLVNPWDLKVADLVQLGSFDFLTTESEVSDATLIIINELKTTLDVGEAAHRLLEMRANPIKLRETSVEIIIQAALDSEKPAERMALAALVAGLVLPRRFVTADMLKRVATTFISSYDDLLPDYPLLPQYFADIFGPLVPSIIAREDLPEAVLSIGGFSGDNSTNSGAKGSKTADKLSSRAADLQDKYAGRW